MGRLTAVTIKSLRHDPAKGSRPVRFPDGEGLYLQIAQGGSKSWLFRYTLQGKAREMGLGALGDAPDGTSLAEARRRAAASRALLSDGIDPLNERVRVRRQRDDDQAASEAARARTFRSVAMACIEAEAPGWKNVRTALLWKSSLERHAYPVLGDLPVSQIDRALVKKAIEAVWSSAPSIGRKVLRRIAAVLRYAAAHGWRANDNPADARMLRYAGLPALPGGKNYPSLPWMKTAAFMAKLKTMEGQSALVLQAIILTALRSGEVRKLRWSYLSFDGTPTLTVPGEEMKGKKSAEVLPHRVPLAAATIEVLAKACGHAVGYRVPAEGLPGLLDDLGSALIFPSQKRGVPLSDMAVSMVVRRMNADRPEGQIAPWRDADGRPAVPHGFRATFSTWVDDTCPQEREAAERALAHEIANKVSGAYRRSDLFDRRIPLMSAWADHCSNEAG